MNVIEAKHIAKRFRIFKRPIDRLKEALWHKSKLYGEDFYALNDVTFNIEKGETFGIVGVNGAGKSTLLKIITGITDATQGSICVNGRVSALLELGMGFNVQYTGRENIYLNGIMRGISKSEMDERITEIIRFADIGSFIDNPVRLYSSGMFARLAFAVAINVDPEILIVDEALAVGDAAFQAKCFRKFEQMRNRGITILFVSHDIGSVKRLCNRAMWLENGRIREIGEASRVCNRFSSFMMERRNKQLIEDETENTPQSKNDEVARIEAVDINGRWPKIPADCDRAGTGDARIISCYVTDDRGEMTTQLSVYKVYEFHVVAKFLVPKKEVLLGLVFENTRALSVFYLNNYNEDTSMNVTEPGVYEMIFKITLPGLQKNEYLISPAVATGTQVENIMHDWCHNALTVQVYNPGFNLSVLDLNADDIVFKQVNKQNAL